MDRDAFLEAVHVSKKRDRADTDVKRRVSLADAKRCIQIIQVFHKLGRKVRQSLDSIKTYAEKSGHKPGKLTVARLFAERYTASQLNTLCDEIERCCPAFGTSHIGILITVEDGPWREELQRECIENNWTISELKAAKAQRCRLDCNRGRPPRVSGDNLRFLLQQCANRFAVWLTVRGLR